MVFRDQNRTIEALEAAQLLPGAVYWSEKIAAPRSHWFAGSLHQTASCDLVFLDPDNGVAGLRAFAEGSPKHVFLDEIRSLVQRKSRPSVVIYHHVDHLSDTAEEKTERQLERLSSELGLSLAERPFGVLFRRWAVRAFLILPNQDHRASSWSGQERSFRNGARTNWGSVKRNLISPVPFRLDGPGVRR